MKTKTFSNLIGRCMVTMTSHVDTIKCKNIMRSLGSISLNIIERMRLKFQQVRSPKSIYVLDEIKTLYVSKIQFQNSFYIFTVWHVQHVNVIIGCKKTVTREKPSASSQVGVHIIESILHISCLQKLKKWLIHFFIYSCVSVFLISCHRIPNKTV